jgi:hypothetical protein
MIAHSGLYDLVWMPAPATRIFKDRRNNTL